MSNNSLVLLDCADPNAERNEASCYSEFGENQQNKKPEILARLGHPNMSDFAWGSCWLEKKKMLAVQLGDGFTYFHDSTTFKEKRPRLKTVIAGGIAMCAPLVATKEGSVLITGGCSTVNCFLLSEDLSTAKDQLLLKIDGLLGKQNNAYSLDIHPTDDSKIVCGGSVLHLIQLNLDISSTSSYKVLRKLAFPVTGGDILSMKFSPLDGNKIIATFSSNVLVWDLLSSPAKQQQEGEVTTQENEFEIIDAKKSVPSKKEKGLNFSQLWFARLSRDCKSILIAPDSATSAALLDISSPEKIENESKRVAGLIAVYTHSDDGGSIFDAQFSDREDFVLLLGRSASLTLHKAKTGERLWCLKLGSWQAYSMTASSSKDTFAVCTHAQSEEAKKASVVVVKVPQMRNRYEARRPCVLIKFKGKGKLAQEGFEVWDIFVLSALFM